MQNSYSKTKKGMILITFLLLSILFLLPNANAIPIESCPNNYIGVAIGSQNAHLFRNDINIGIYDGLDSEFRTGTGTNITFTLQAMDEILSLQAFPIGNIFVNSQINQSTGRITMNIPQDSHGSHMIIIYAEIETNQTDSVSCRTILSYPVIAYYRPIITEVLPSENITINENDIARISLMVKDIDTPQNSLAYRWFKDGEAQDNNNSFYEWVTDYESEGSYNMIVRVTDEKGLYSQKKMNLTIMNVNRPPVMRFPLSNLVMNENEQGKNVDLMTFFVDPDKDLLTYSIDITYFEDSMNRSNIDELVELRVRDQTFNVRRLNPVEARIGVMITATDPYGAFVRSNVFVIDIFDFNVSSRTLRATEDCPITTECSDWGFCTLDAIQTRECTDTDCNGNQDYYLQKQSCDPEATCYDGIKNCPFGICEEDVDCGGPCEPCRECDHPSCMAIFCPGGCKDGHVCNTDRQCKSLNCEDYVCQVPTCSDGIRNQGEDGVDCGGPCEACPTCNDNIQNQGEDGVDCGGPCDRECITLNYIFRNYWGIIPLIGLVIIIILVNKMLYDLKFLSKLIRSFRLGRKYSNEREKIFALRKRVSYAVENPYGTNGASRANYEGLLEEFTSILLRKNFLLSEQSIIQIKKEKIPFLTKRTLISLLTKAKAQQSSLFSVAYPVLLRELREIIDSYARVLAYDKTTTHL